MWGKGTQISIFLEETGKAHIFEKGQCKSELIRIPGLAVAFHSFIARVVSEVLCIRLNNPRG